MMSFKNPILYIHLVATECNSILIEIHNGGRHCSLWREYIPRPPPSAKPPPEPVGCETLDCGFTSTRLSASFEQNCA